MAWWIFQNLVITTVLAAAVAVVCRAGRIGPVARHALWVLVLVKFVTPPIVVWPWAAPDPLGIATIDARAGDRGVAFVHALQAQPAGAGGVEIGMEPVDQAALQDQRDRVEAGLGAAAWPWFLGVWAAGSLCLLGIEGVRLGRLARRVRAATPADAAIVTRVAALSARLGVRPLPVVAVAGGGSPAVWGWGRPRLLWPAALPADATDACIDGLLVHELAHVKRGDHLVGWIELAAGVLWWWNPLFWSVRSALREQAELACDAWVISSLPNGRRAYAESLLLLSGAAVPAASSMAVIGVRATSRRMLERRLVMIMKGRAPLRLPMAGLFCLALVAAATLPAWATAAQQAPPSPQTVTPVVKPAPATLSPPTVTVVPRPVPARVLVNGQNPPPKPATTIQVKPVVVAPDPSNIKAVVVMPDSRNVKLHVTTRLPAEGEQVLDAFEVDRLAIQEEADRKLQARRAAAVKALEDLQAQFTKAGKLDEAVAIRDYLRAGGPAQSHQITIRRKG